jgi:Icc-related predicted phosphoesterase
MRIVALSDQHGHLPEIPTCDLVIVAGDVCPDRFGPFLALQHPEQQKAWFDRVARHWLDRAPAVYKVLTWGNHDWCGQACEFGNNASGIADAGELQILVDESTTIPLCDDGDGLSLWASPWSNPFLNWAFMKSPAELATVYDSIPEGTDIVVSHQPPYGCGDHGLGSHELRAAIRGVKPRLVICGHIHEGFGRFECEGVMVYNVSVVDEQYRLVHEPTLIELS